MPELQFKGKEFVYNHHLTVPFRPLEMHADKSVLGDIGEPRLDGNLIVHGDNLHALKALLPSYAGKVDCIFIDPPYNTGNEGWAYNDNVNSPMIREWLEANPIGLEDGLRHDKWACMMWPRLKLLHELLAETGSIWIALDDNESHNARSILDEIFGDQNFVANVIWEKVHTRKNSSQYFSYSHDNILVYAKSKPKWPRPLLTRENSDAYSNPDNNAKGPWKADPITAHNRYSADYKITKPNGIVLERPEGRYWAFSEESINRKIENDEIIWGEGKSYPMIKRFLSEVQDGIVPITIFDRIFAGDTSYGKKEIDRIFGKEGVFEYPKPSKLIQRIIDIAAKPNALILDSFAGSGTTAHAVLSANAKDGGNRKFILVEGEDYADNLTAERVRRVINGYSFTGTQKDELLRENITFTKLKNADKLLDQVQAIENLDGPKYDKIAKTVKDGTLIVTGEKKVTEKTEGLGGEFTYCTLGAPIEMDAILSGDALPTIEAIAGLLWHTATATPLPADAMTAAPEIGDGAYRLGTFAGRSYWLFYRADRDWLKSAEAALSLTKARAIAQTAPGNHLVFAPAKFVSRELLGREKIDVDYAPLPFALYRLETA